MTEGVSVRLVHVPASWPRALRPGGRLVTTIAGTGLILTADKTADGGACGRIEGDRAGFMRTRHGDDYEHWADELRKGSAQDEGETSFSRYLLLYPPDAWDVMSTAGSHPPPARPSGHRTAPHRTAPSRAEPSRAVSERRGTGRVFRESLAGFTAARLYSGIAVPASGGVA
ncbi:hypothetical protein ABZ137_41330 [Streptomyces bobili]|uniref:hypothetical protein n=1 Tax=Streptomyces bobili TaxID=67280 RepID=UPI0033B3371F